MSQQPSSSNPDPATNEYTDHIVCKRERWPLDDVGRPLQMLQALDRVVPAFEFVARAENLARMSLHMRLPRLRSNVVSVRIALRSGAAAGAGALHPAALVRFRYTEALCIACRFASSCFASTASAKALLATAIIERVFRSRRSKCLVRHPTTPAHVTKRHNAQNKLEFRILERVLPRFMGISEFRNSGIALEQRGAATGF